MVSMVKKTILVVSVLVSQVAHAQKTVPWTWQKNDCRTCGVSLKLVGDVNADMSSKEKYIRFVLSVDQHTRSLLAAHDADAVARTAVFLHTLSAEKQNILKLYNSDPQEYNLLAHMAIGILGQESRYFAHWKYFIKRNSQLAIKGMKELKALMEDRDAVANSKGPTQIKKVPSRIAQFYNMNEKNLWDPKYAAVATMGYLIEALGEMKQRAKNNHLEFITPATYVDYLPYLYFGGTKKLVNRTATPEKNIYVKNMKRQMKKVVVSEIVK